MNLSTSNRTSYIKTAAIAVIILVVASVGIHYANYYILGKAPAAKLSPSPLSTTVSQSLGTTASGTTPVAGQDFTIRSIQYYENNTWAIVFVAPVKNNANNAILVVHKQNGKYKTVLGPGTSFAASSLPSLPTPVLFYLNSQGMISNEPAGD